MYGIKTDELQRLIGSLDSDVSDIKSGLLALYNSVNTLSAIFKSNGINNVSTNLQSVYDRQANITKILDNYVEILKQVVLNYQKQDEMVSNSLTIVTKN